MKGGRVLNGYFGGGCLGYQGWGVGGGGAGSVGGSQGQGQEGALAVVAAARAVVVAWAGPRAWSEAGVRGVRAACGAAAMCGCPSGDPVSGGRVLTAVFRLRWLGLPRVGLAGWRWGGVGEGSQGQGQEVTQAAAAAAARATVVARAAKGARRRAKARRDQSRLWCSCRDRVPWRHLLPPAVH